MAPFFNDEQFLSILIDMIMTDSLEKYYNLL